MSNSIVEIDVRDLPAPGPLEKVLALLAITPRSDIVCMIHRQHPCSLFSFLEDRGYSSSVLDKGNLIYIYIWSTENLEAPLIVEGEIKRAR